IRIGACAAKRGSFRALPGQRRLGGTRRRDLGRRGRARPPRARTFEGVPFMFKDREWGRDQRGIALVVSLLVLVFLSLLASALLVSINVETKIAARTSRADRALNAAEAGIAEALERIRIGDVPDND